MTDLVASSIVTGVFVLVAGVGGSLGTTWLRQSSDERLRRLDHDHEHREGLQERRFAAYDAFDAAFAHYREVYADLGGAWLRREMWGERLKSTALGPEHVELVVRFDQADAEWKEQLVRATGAAERLDSALSAVERVATTAVFERAAELKVLLRTAWGAQRDLASKMKGEIGPPEDWQQLQNAEAAVVAGRRVWMAEVRRELGLDTPPVGRDT